MPIEIYHVYGYVKKAAALVNQRLGHLPKVQADLIVKSVDRVEASLTGLYQLAAGGTVVDTGLNTLKERGALTPERAGAPFRRSTWRSGMSSNGPKKKQRNSIADQIITEPCSIELRPRCLGRTHQTALACATMHRSRPTLRQMSRVAVQVLHRVMVPGVTSANAYWILLDERPGGLAQAW